MSVQRFNVLVDQAAQRASSQRSTKEQPNQGQSGQASAQEPPSQEYKPRFVRADSVSGE